MEDVTISANQAEAKAAADALEAKAVEAGAAAVQAPSCDCADDGAGHPELDARAIPHAIRHSTVFGALDAIRPGKSLVLVAPHDPLPLLRQQEARDPGAFTVSYLQRGPEAWRLLLTRAAG